MYTQVYTSQVSLFNLEKKVKKWNQVTTSIVKIKSLSKNSVFECSISYGILYVTALQHRIILGKSSIKGHNLKIFQSLRRSPIQLLHCYAVKFEF